MVEGYEDKTTFFAGVGVFCYQKMPFGLKNARATYQRLVDKIFHDQIGRNLEAYIDDMVIKSTSKEDMLADIKETLERSLPFFKTLKSGTDKKNIRWTQEAEASLHEMKKFVEDLPTLTTRYGESRVLQGAELNYPALEKLILALVHAARRLRRYFQAHTVTVLTDSPIKQALTKPKKSRQVDKWAIELGEHDIVKKEAEGRTDTKSENTKLNCEWKLYTNGATSSDGSGVGLMLIHPEGKDTRYGNRKLGDFRRLSVVGKSNKGYLRSQATNDQRIPAEDKRVLVEVLSKRSIEEKEILQVETNEEESWMTPIHEYLVRGLLLEDPKESRKIRVKAPQNKLIRGSLYRRATLNGGLNYKARILLAVDAQRRRKVNSRLREMQGTICDKESSRKQCNNSWKWMAVQSLGSQHPRTFANISRRLNIFGNSHRTLREMGRRKASNNYKQKTCGNICMGIGLKVTQSFSLVTEHMEIMNHIEKQLTRSQQGWADDLAQVLWIHRTLPRNSQKETPFSLTYGSEAIIPIAKNAVAKDDKGRT
ncbi:reverse transcriptase domain-containing protein [Tanacetum coccineum]